MWFAAMGQPREYPWAVHLVWKLLQGDPGVRTLLAEDPLAGAPPRWIRVELYRYRFARRGQAGWWERTRLGPWLPPLARDSDGLETFLRGQGWIP
jgi:hypothetical protein